MGILDTLISRYLVDLMAKIIARNGSILLNFALSGGARPDSVFDSGQKCVSDDPENRLQSRVAHWSFANLKHVQKGKDLLRWLFLVERGEQINCISLCCY